MALPDDYSLAFCVPCDARDRTIDPGGRCISCGQHPDQPAAGECSMCGGEGVVDGVVIRGQARQVWCPACGGSGRYGTASPTAAA